MRKLSQGIGNILYSFQQNVQIDTSEDLQYLIFISIKCIFSTSHDNCQSALQWFTIFNIHFYLQIVASGDALSQLPPSHADSLQSHAGLKHFTTKHKLVKSNVK